MDGASSSSRAPQPPKATPVISGARKIGRNNNCSCGSGKKFKRCCLGKPLFQESLFERAPIIDQPIKI